MSRGWIGRRPRCTMDADAGDLRTKERSIGNGSSAAQVGASAPQRRFPLVAPAFFCGLPMSRKLLVGSLGLKTQLSLPLANLSELVGVDRPLSPPLLGTTCTEFQHAQFFGGQRRTGKSVVLGPGKEVPGEDSQLASDRHSGHLQTTPGSNALIASPQGPRRLDRCPCGFDEGAAGVRTTLFGDPTISGRTTAGLSDTGIQTEITDKLCGRGEATDVADCCDKGQGHCCIESGDRKEPTHIGALLPNLPGSALLDLIPPQLDRAHARLLRQPLSHVWGDAVKHRSLAIGVRPSQKDRPGDSRGSGCDVGCRAPDSSIASVVAPSGCDGPPAVGKPASVHRESRLRAASRRPATGPTPPRRPCQF